jgi:hypothetical protein
LPPPAPFTLQTVRQMAARLRRQPQIIDKLRCARVQNFRTVEVQTPEHHAHDDAKPPPRYARAPLGQGPKQRGWRTRSPGQRVRRVMVRCIVREAEEARARLVHGLDGAVHESVLTRRKRCGTKSMRLHGRPSSVAASYHPSWLVVG